MALTLGIDIHSNSVRGALARTRFGRVELIRYLEVEFSQLPQDYDGEKELGPTAAIAQIVKDAGAEIDAFVVALSGEKVSFRTLDVPTAASKKLLSVLPFELEPMLPFAVEDAVVDYQVIRKSRQSQHLLVVSTLRKHLTDLLDVFRPAKVEPREIATGAPALESLYLISKEIGQAQPEMVVFLRDACMDAAIVFQGVTLAARTVTLPSALLSPIKYAQNVESALVQLMAAYRSQEEREFHLELQRVSSKTTRSRRSKRKAKSASTESPTVSESPPALPRLWLAGDVDALRDTTQLGETLGMQPVWVPMPVVPEPFETSGDPAAQRLKFAFAAALAVRPTMRHKRFNLRQGDFAFKQTIGVLRSQLKLVGMCLGGIFLALIFSSVIKWQTLKQQDAYLNARLLTESRAILGTETSDLDKLQTLLAPPTAQDDPLPKMDVYDALGYVSEKIPEAIVHNARLFLVELPHEKTPGRLQLEGTVPSITKRDEIAANLMQHPCVRDMQKGRVSPTVDNTGVNYQLEAVLRCGAATAKPSAKGEKEGDHDNAP